MCLHQCNLDSVLKGSARCVCRSEGDEITFSYAHFPNSHFYFRYGFSIPEV